MDAKAGVLAKSVSCLVAAALTSMMAVLASCSGKPTQPPSAGANQQAGPNHPENAVPAQPAVPITATAWATDTLEKLLAPIALYPDRLVGQILAASISPQEVLDGGNWLLEHQGLIGKDLDSAAVAVGFGPAVRALLQVPTVLDMMCRQIDWTRELGAAFLSDQGAVLDAVQRLRSQAAAVGNLKSSTQQTVETTTDPGTTVFVVQPANSQVIYVPQYDPQVVYTTPPPAAPTAVGTNPAVMTGLLAFGVGNLVASAIHNDNCYPHWGQRAVYVGHRPFYPPAYVYRPAYGPAFRPARSYSPPPGYRNNYDNAHVNNDININVDKNNYFSQFNGNQNLRPSAYSDRNAANKAAQNRNGQTSHTSASRNAQKSPNAPFGGNRMAANDTAPSRNSAVDRGYATPSQSAAASKRDNTFSGAASTASSGGFDRAASARGRASDAAWSGATDRSGTRRWESP